MSNVGVGTRDCGDCVWLTSDPDVVTARERGRALAETLGFSAVDQASVETTISELAINMLTYARSGEIRLEVVSDAGSTGLRIVARDWGSGVDSLGFSESAAAHRRLRDPQPHRTRHRRHRHKMAPLREALSSVGQTPSGLGRGEAPDTAGASSDHAHLRRTNHEADRVAAEHRGKNRRLASDAADAEARYSFDRGSCALRDSPGPHRSLRGLSAPTSTSFSGQLALQ